MNLNETIENPVNYPEYWFYIRRTDKKRKKNADIKLKEKEKKEQYILCSYCENKITLPKFKFEFEGAFNHTFLNPSGHVFQIGCFERADGCAVFGEPTTEWTWFPGFSWQIALCNQCLKHLGWYYTPISDGQRAFFGLILNMLK